MYVTYALRPMGIRHGKVEVEGQLKEKERSVISGGPWLDSWASWKKKVSLWLFRGF